MATVVFTSVNSVDDIESATWIPGDNDSYEHTKRMAMDCKKDILLIGRKDKYDRVQLCYAKSEDQDWTVAGPRHVLLAQYFLRKAKSLPSDWDGRPFITEIDDDAARDASQQLIALECGVGVTKERSGPLHIAVLQVQRGLRALGISCADWTFVPMFASFETALA